LKTDRKPPV